jgi:predicted amidohydrolase
VDHVSTRLIINILTARFFINAEGKIISVYDKMHLFYFNNTTPGQVSHDEASKYLPGKSMTLRLR